MKHYRVVSSRPNSKMELCDKTMVTMKSLNSAEIYLHAYIRERIENNRNTIIISDDGNTYKDEDDNIIYERPTGYQCGLPFWYDDWTLEMFRIYAEEVN